MEQESRYTGCLVAGGAGDALGYTVEFSSAAQIRSKYGAKGITQFDLTAGRALISDDTQMTLFTASGLLNAKGSTMEDYISSIWNSYLAWYRTQTQKGPIDDPSQPLLKNGGLFARRAPGGTCLSALRNRAPGSIKTRINDSKGCGGVMRVAPVGLYFALDAERSLEWIDMLGARAAALTHTHPLGYIAAAGLVHIVCSIVREPAKPLEAVVEDMLQMMEQLFGGSSDIGDFVSLLRRAMALVNSVISDAEAIQMLGEGWVAEETLAIAVFCALRHPSDVETALQAAVNHDGDSDSTGAVTGNILGTLCGLESVPKQYIEHLEFAALLDDMGAALYEAN